MRVDQLYGYTVCRPEMSGKWLPPEPIPWWKRAYYTTWAFVNDVVIPAFMFALAITCFSIAFR